MQTKKNDQGILVLPVSTRETASPAKAGGRRAVAARAKARAAARQLAEARFRAEVRAERELRVSQAREAGRRAGQPARAANELQLVSAAQSRAERILPAAEAKARQTGGVASLASRRIAERHAAAQAALRQADHLADHARKLRAQAESPSMKASARALARAAQAARAAALVGFDPAIRTVIRKAEAAKKALATLRKRVQDLRIAQAFWARSVETATVGSARLTVVDGEVLLPREEAALQDSLDRAYVAAHGDERFAA